MTDPFSAPGKFWRGNLHAHSTRSDGVLDPGEVCRRYRAAGYDFISVTDHLVGLFNYPITDTRAWQSPDFSTIPGAELHAGRMENGHLWHMLAVGLPLDFEPPDCPLMVPGGGEETAPALARRARDVGAFIAIAHPEWSGLTMHDAMSIDAAHAVEIYNHSCHRETDRGHGLGLYDLLAAKGRRLGVLAADDAHLYERDTYGGWVMVKAVENAPDALLEALKAGHCYATTGPEIYAIHWEEHHVVVESSAASAVYLLGLGEPAHAIHGTAMTCARIPLDMFRDSPWIRIVVADAKGGRAWTAHWHRDVDNHSFALH